MFQDREGVRKVIRIAWPAIVESVFTAATTLIDGLMLSVMGSSAIAAVGLTMQPKFISLSPFIAVHVTVNALIARRKGQNDRMDAHRILVAALIFTVIAAILIGVIAVGVANPLMRLVGAREDTYQDAVNYFSIVVGFLVFQAVTMVINSAQRGTGKSYLSMRTNVVSSAVNIFFNWVLIEGHLGFPALGVIGAAVATVLGSVAGCALAVCSLLSKDSFLSMAFIRHYRPKISKNTFWVLGSLASNVFLENILVRAGFMVTALMAALMDTDALAAHNVGLNLLTLSFSVGDGIQAAATALIGQNLGARRPDLAKHYGRICLELGAVAAACIAVLYFLFGRAIFRSYFPDELYAVECGVIIIRFLVVTVIVQLFQCVYMGSLRAAGDAKYVMFAFVMSVTVVRAGLGLIFCQLFHLGLVGLWMSIFADQFCRYLFTSIRYRKGKWTEIVI